LFDGYGNTFDDSREKRASSKIAKEAGIKPRHGYAYVHLVSVAAGDVYGPNSNDDFYNEGSMPWTYHLAEGGPRTEQLGGGLIEHHASYMKHGGVYREHQNSKQGFQKLGNVVWQRYNPEMHYGELIVELPTKDWSSTLQKLASGKPVYWSQGSTLSFDICSGCGNKRTKVANGCEHIKKHAGRMTKEGIQIFMINDHPVFHDISEVRQPAERVAFSLERLDDLEKAASTGILDPKSFRMPNIPVSYDIVRAVAGMEGASRHELLIKLAKEEKHVSEKMDKADEAIASAVESDEDTDNRVADKLKNHPIGDLQSHLVKNKCLLSPRGFACILVSKAGRDPKHPNVASAIERMKEFTPTMFSDILSSGEMGDLLDDGSYVANCSPSCGKAAVDEVTPDLSISPEAIADKVVKVTVSKTKPKKVEKKASVSPEIDEVAKTLVNEYAKYQLTTLAAIGPSPFNTRTAVIINRS